MFPINFNQLKMGRWGTKFLKLVTKFSKIFQFPIWTPKPKSLAFRYFNMKTSFLSVSHQKDSNDV